MENAQNVEDLKNLGTFNEVRRDIRRTVEGKLSKGPIRLSCSIRSWADLLTAVEDFRKVENALKTNGDPYFQSDAQRYIFALLRMDGPSRMEQLGLTRSHYSDPKGAKTWHRKIAREISPDRCDHPEAEEAFQELENLYANVSER